MRTAMLAIVVLGLGVIGEAQTPAPTKKVQARSSAVLLDRSLELRGEVKVQIGNIEIMADEADVNAEGKAWSLRGNVRMIEH